MKEKKNRSRRETSKKAFNIYISTYNTLRMKVLLLITRHITLYFIWHTIQTYKRNTETTSWRVTDTSNSYSPLMIALFDLNVFIPQMLGLRNLFFFLTYGKF